MGLQLAEDISGGYSMNYWKIERCEVDYTEEVVRINMAGFKSKTDKDGGESLVSMKNERIPLADITFASSDIRDDLYPKVKALDDWSGASDVYEDGQP